MAENQFLSYYLLVKGPGVARGEKILKKRLAYNTPWPPLSVHKNFRPISPTVWPDIGNIFIYTNVLFFILTSWRAWRCPCAMFFFQFIDEKTLKGFQQNHLKTFKLFPNAVHDKKQTWYYMCVLYSILDIYNAQKAVE